MIRLAVAMIPNSKSKMNPEVCRRCVVNPSKSIWDSDGEVFFVPCGCSDKATLNIFMLCLFLSFVISVPDQIKSISTGRLGVWDPHILTPRLLTSPELVLNTGHHGRARHRGDLHPGTAQTLCPLTYCQTPGCASLHNRDISSHRRCWPDWVRQEYADPPVLGTGRVVLRWKDHRRHTGMDIHPRTSSGVVQIRTTADH